MPQLKFPLLTVEVRHLLGLSEGQVRHAIDLELDPLPNRTSRGYEWAPEDVLRLASVTGTVTPELAEGLLHVVQGEAVVARRRLRRMRRVLAANEVA